VVRESARIEYTPKPQFVMSDDLLPGETKVWEGVEWSNKGSVPCRFILYVGTPVFWIACDKMESVQGDLRNVRPNEEFTLRPKK
jgi:hypothetical protein